MHLWRLSLAAIVGFSAALLSNEAIAQGSVGQNVECLRHLRFNQEILAENSARTLGIFSRMDRATFDQMQQRGEFTSLLPKAPFLASFDEMQSTMQMFRSVQALDFDEVRSSLLLRSSASSETVRLMDLCVNGGQEPLLRVELRSIGQGDAAEATIFWNANSLEAQAVSRFDIIIAGGASNSERRLRISPPVTGTPYSFPIVRDVGADLSVDVIPRADRLPQAQSLRQVGFLPRVPTVEIGFEIVERSSIDEEFGGAGNGNRFRLHSTTPGTASEEPIVISSRSGFVIRQSTVEYGTRHVDGKRVDAQIFHNVVANGVTHQRRGLAVTPVTISGMIAGAASPDGVGNTVPVIRWAEIRYTVRVGRDQHILPVDLR